MRNSSRKLDDQSLLGEVVMALMLAACLAVGTTSVAEEMEEEVVELETFIAGEEVEDDLGLLQTEPVESVFGFDKSILETPRAVSSISAEFLEEFNVTSINDIVTFVPGTFTTSFFGVAGSLDVRGTSAENYFRGVKRINNEGNFPTAIGASDRIDVIRGPMSPIAGPGKVGGALNFVPKSARAETGQYLEKATGSIGYTTGSWDKSVVVAEVGGPTKIMGRDAGYYMYAEIENSDAYYNNDFTRQNLIQGTLNFDLSSNTRVEAGFMYQEWRGHENGGWNRVTQDLIDHEIYITGQPAINIDSTFGNGDGLMQESEIDAFEAFQPSQFNSGSFFAVDDNGVPFADATCFSGISVFCLNADSGAALTQNLVDQLSIGLDPATVGTAKLRGSSVLIDDTDQYDTDANVVYFDIIHETDGGMTITNKMFYEEIEYINVDGYGFTKIADTWVFENQLIFAFDYEGDSFESAFQISPSVRYTDAFYALDFSDEIFDRPDLTVGFNANSLQQVPSRAPNESWSAYTNSDYWQYGLAFLMDSTIGDNLDLLIGVRYDYVDVESEDGDGAGPVVLQKPGTARGIGEGEAEESDDAVTWSASLSYALGPFNPYVTVAEQTTIISGSAGDVSLGNVQGETFLGDSELTEFGIKTSLLDGRLYASVAYFEQERISFDAQNPVNNQANEAEGYEIEIRTVVNEKFSFVATYSDLEVDVIQESGEVFSYIGPSNFPHIDPASVFGGIIGANHVVGTRTPRGGIPEVSWSISGTQTWNEKFRTGFSYTSVDETASSVVAGIILPDYEVLNLNATYETANYRLSLYLSNVTDELYFRGNFPSLYGNNAVLPSTPRSWALEFVRKF